ncbi:hypothetical protein NNJEOMEG_02950 [Fundidesulfovibrio magnetotacticus]|uniref:ApbE family lipoprotein n=1 Tax=Fundidesulfovibrio magnetotacticus TaxID=2730080 RepID=A0A6V8LZ81_9BACT|nr:UPF0280 family protein [Fundidesulfovibrio magnetotacticus]GFK95096.1 hypothetical protein NNJEOMEG_02950 [Fundidesulfovibrio magnetotacticus]
MIHRDTQRTYRGLSEPAQGEVRFAVTVEESDLLVTARRDLSAETAQVLNRLRGQLKNHILLHPEFRPSLTPLPDDPSAPPLVGDMLRAARACQVGPMAAVAGTIAQHVADALAPLSPDLLVENGGDVALRSTRERLVALLARPVQGARLALRLAPREFPVCLCTSSATVGHSLSFGAADMVTVKARSGAVADAAATTLGNLARGEAHLPLVLERARELARVGVLGVFVQVGEKIGVWGDMELAALE